MSLMDKVREYNQLKDDKKIYLERLDKSLKRLEKNKPDYALVAMNIIKGLEKRLDVSLGDSCMILDSKDFKVGDRVIAQKDYRDKKLTGLKGQIINFTRYGDVDFFGVEFEKYISGHGCEGKAKYGHGYFVPRSYFKRIVDIKHHTDVKTRDDYVAFTESLVDRVLEASKQNNTGFKKGDKVRIRTDSKYFKDEGKHGIAVIDNDHMAGSDHNLRLKFEDDYTNTYRSRDIEFVTPPRKFSKASVKSMIDRVVFGVEAEFGVDEYVLKREELIKKSIPRLEDFNFNNSDIINYFSTRLSDVSDVEEALK